MLEAHDVTEATWRDATSASRTLPIPKLRLSLVVGNYDTTVNTIVELQRKLTTVGA